MATAAPAKTSAFMKALTPAPAPAAPVGAEPLPRTEVTKKVWDYIKAHNLQNPANKRNILCDAKLKAVMGKDEVTMFEMTGLVGKHLSCPESCAPARDARASTRGRPARAEQPDREPLEARHVDVLHD